MKRVIRVAIIGCFLGCISFHPLYSAWWNESRIPVPHGAQEANREMRSMGGNDMEFIYYTSAQNAAAIKDFYRKNLRNLGWQEKDLFKEIAAVPNVGLDESFLKQNAQSSLIFEKEGEVLIITFPPSEFFKDTMTRFTIAKTNSGDQQGVYGADSASFIPALKERPKREIAPVYPGASLVTLSEDATSQDETYFTQENIEEVIRFYKSKMPDFGWKLTRDYPIREMVMDEAANIDMERHCPSCPKEAIVRPQDINVWMASLTFSNNKGGVCHVVVSQSSVDSIANLPANMTTIVIKYEEKS